jgi:hypothetical protein
MAPSSLALAADAITHADFLQVLSRYDALIQSVSKPSNRDGETLEQLDAFRLVGVPRRLEGVRGEGGEVYLEKEEVERLIRWKLYVRDPSDYQLTIYINVHSKHGKFRPSLLQLVSSNSDAQIRAATASAFASLAQDGAIQTGVLPALNKLTVLRGIGPASASLLLSVAFEGSVPFFSDEAFRWVMAGADYASNAGGKGWNRNINYDKKEYGEFVRRVRAVMQRLGAGVKAVDVEKVGWVLGKEKAVVVVTRARGEEISSPEVAIKTAVKRGAHEAELKEAIGNSGAVGGPRRSKRQRK